MVDERLRRINAEIQNVTEWRTALATTLEKLDRRIEQLRTDADSILEPKLPGLDTGIVPGTRSELAP